MTSVDLDAVEDLAVRVSRHEGDPRVTLHCGDVLALVAELRAAREVVDAVRNCDDPDDPPPPPVRDALAAYDRAVSS